MPTGVLSEHEIESALAASHDPALLETGYAIRGIWSEAQVGSVLTPRLRLARWAHEQWRLTGSRVTAARVSSALRDAVYVFEMYAPDPPAIDGRHQNAPSVPALSRPGTRAAGPSHSGSVNNSSPSPASASGVC